MSLVSERRSLRKTFDFAQRHQKQNRSGLHPFKKSGTNDSHPASLYFPPPNVNLHCSIAASSSLSD
jgi:hypothetical protein